VADRAREGHGADYTLDDYGLQVERIDELYAPYMAAYGVEKEHRK
jgi:hypothetical protein